jgi:ribonuclease BN (tRNA processing enzyme)
VPAVSPAASAAYVIDCGDGVARQLVFAGVPLPSLRHIFLTHQHSDHNADYGNLIWLAWASGLRTRVDTWGPPPLRKMTELFFEMNKYDIDVSSKDLEAIQKRALAEGLPYQTLIASLLHKYAAGRLKEF